MDDQFDESTAHRLFKEDAERPIDLDMLTDYCDAFQEHIQVYSSILSVLMEASVHRKTWSRDLTDSINQRFEELEELPLWKENLETVHAFLEELHVITSPELATIGEFEGTSFHWAAMLVFVRLRSAWDSVCRVSERSRVDRRYAYHADPRDLFIQVWAPQFPAPQRMGEILRREFVLARAELRKTEKRSDSEPAVAHSQFEMAGDNDSKDSLLIGDMYRICGLAGHLFLQRMQWDKGIDGEIEFKDEQGNATGCRVYVQLKSGDSWLNRRKRDGVEIFRIKKQRHALYWRQHSYPVMLVIRRSTGEVLWMDIREYLRARKGSSVRQVEFVGAALTPATLQDYARRAVATGGAI